MSIPSFPSLVIRSVKGSPLSDSELDANWTNTRSYCLTLANLISSSLNPDGTLVSGSVGSQTLQNAAVALSNLNPSLLYSIIPVDTDAGTLNAYAITARGGLNGSNVVPGAATYDSNGNYVLSGLSLNNGYVFTRNAHDATMVNGSQTISAAGPQTFTAANTSVTLTGTASATVTATVGLAAPISTYKDSQVFFVYTTNANTAAATLNVNGLGAVPIVSNGVPLTSGTIGAPTVFSVVYKGATFILLSGGGSSGTAGAGSSTAVASYTVNGTNRFTSGGVAIPTSASVLNITHGLAQVPTSTRVYLNKIAAETSSDSVVSVGAYVPYDLFFTSASTPTPWMTISIESTYVNVNTSASTTLYLAGVGTALTPANWAIVVVCDVTTNVSNTILPAVTYPFPSPELAISYGNNLIVSNFGISGLRPFSCVNLATNVAMPLSYPDAGVPAYCNAAAFLRSSGKIEAVFTSNAGHYRLPMISPLLSIVPSYAVYNSSGIYNLTVTVSTTYTFAAGANDTSWSLDGTTYNTTATITTSASQTTLYLKSMTGKQGYLVTATVVTSGAVWQANRLGTQNYYYTKPVWITETAGSITNIYSVDSNYNSSIGLNAVRMFNFSVSPNTTAQVTGTIDLTTSTIGNSSDFRKWYGTAVGPSGASSNVGTRIQFFQYNPVSQRIYVSAGDVPFIHIFKITSTYATGIVGWWADANKYTALSYVKSIAIGGDGAPWADYGRCNLTVEYDLTTGGVGTEKCSVLTRWGSSVTGTVARVPWVEA